MNPIPGPLGMTRNELWIPLHSGYGVLFQDWDRRSVSIFIRTS